MSNAIIVEDVGLTKIVKFNRPQFRSPLTIAVLTELLDVVDDASAFDRLIFTGVGDVFASGADLNEIALVTSQTAAEFALRGQRLTTTIAAWHGSAIAVVNGYCFGGALDLALACRARIASPTAVFSHPGANLGIMTGWGGTQRLPRLVGEAAALEMFLTAKRVNADEAKAIGLVDSVSSDPMTEALTFEI